jgi:ligand-binding sensor domain-containing protein
VPNVPTHGGYSHILPGISGDVLWFDGGRYPDIFDLAQQTWAQPMELPDGCDPMAMGPNASIWCGGFDGVWIVDADGNPTHVTTEQDLPSMNVSALLPLPSDPPSAWVATDAGLAMLVGDEVKEVVTTEAGLSSDKLTALLAGSDNTLWVGSDDGLDHRLVDGQWVHYGIGSPFGEGFEYVTDLVESADGAIWASTMGEGGVVYRFQNDEWARFSAEDPAVGAGLPNEIVQTLAAGPDGSVWFGTYYHGAARFDGTTWYPVTVQEGLVHPDVLDIYVQPDGTVWFATQGGISRYVP